MPVNFSEFQQHDNATRTHTIDATDWLEDGALIDAGTPPVWAGDGMVVTSPQISADFLNATAQLSAAVEGTEHCVSIVITADDGQVDTYFIKITGTGDPC